MNLLEKRGGTATSAGLHIMSRKNVRRTVISLFMLATRFEKIQWRGCIFRIENDCDLVSRNQQSLPISHLNNKGILGYIYG